MFHVVQPCSGPGRGHTVEGLAVTLADGGRSRTDVTVTWAHQREGKAEAEVQSLGSQGGDLGVEKTGRKRRWVGTCRSGGGACILERPGVPAGSTPAGRWPGGNSLGRRSSPIWEQQIWEERQACNQGEWSKWSREGRGSVQGTGGVSVRNLAVLRGICPWCWRYMAT